MSQMSKMVMLSGKLERAVDEVDHLLASGAKFAALDLSQVSFISVEGLEWLEEMLLRAQSLGAKISLTNIPSPIYKVFKVAHIDIILKACDSPSAQAPVC